MVENLPREVGDAGGPSRRRRPRRGRRRASSARRSRDLRARGGGPARRGELMRRPRDPLWRVDLGARVATV